MKQIPLSRGKIAIVDDGDFAHLSQFKWYAVRSRCKSFDDFWYAQRPVRNPATGRLTSIQMQREIMQPSVGHIVSFGNHDGLDNRRDNLHVVTNSQAMRERRTRPRTLPKGVKGAHQKHGFIASITACSQKLFLGTYPTTAAASAAYRAAAAFFYTYSGHPTRQEQS